jgi:hypothetical protein
LASVQIAGAAGRTIELLWPSGVMPVAMTADALTYRHLALVAMILSLGSPSLATACDSILSQGGFELAGNGSQVSCVFLRNTCSFALDLRAVIQAGRASRAAVTTVPPGAIGQICAGAPGQKVVFSNAWKSAAVASTKGRGSGASALADHLPPRG